MTRAEQIVQAAEILDDYDAMTAGEAYSALDALAAAVALPPDAVDALEAHGVRQIGSLLHDYGVLQRENARLAAALREREADAMGVTNVLGFFASAIKCGDPWTDECEKMLRKAFAHRDAARTTEGA